MNSVDGVLSGLVLVAALAFAAVVFSSVIDDDAKASPPAPKETNFRLSDGTWIWVDAGTGCQYIWKSTLTPRLRNDGKPVCDGTR